MDDLRRAQKHVDREHVVDLGRRIRSERPEEIDEPQPTGDPVEEGPLGRVSESVKGLIRCAESLERLERPAVGRANEHASPARRQLTEARISLGCACLDAGLELGRGLLREREGDHRGRIDARRE
jgi:hypothetical protein